MEFSQASLASTAFGVNWQWLEWGAGPARAGTRGARPALSRGASKFSVGWRHGTLLHRSPPPQATWVGAWRHACQLLHLTSAPMGGLCNPIGDTAWPLSVRPAPLHWPHSLLRPYERHDDDIRSRSSFARAEDMATGLFVAPGHCIPSPSRWQDRACLVPAFQGSTRWADDRTRRGTLLQDRARPISA